MAVLDSYLEHEVMEEYDQLPLIINRFIFVGGILLLLVCALASFLLIIRVDRDFGGLLVFERFS